MTHVIVPEALWNQIKSHLQGMELIQESLEHDTQAYFQFKPVSDRAALLHSQAEEQAQDATEVQEFIEGSAQNAHNAISGDIDDHQSWVYSLNSWHTTMEDAMHVLRKTFDVYFEPEVYEDDEEEDTE